jgi:DNA-binding transcriptional regulator GbsR (MarR family)
MKNTDPPDSTSHIYPLTPELARFVESMGAYFENEGVPRIGGRILGLLLIAHEPLRPEDMASTLKVSRASISTNIRMLTSTSLVEKVSFLHDRHTYFTITEDVWGRAIIAGREKVLAFRSIAELGLEALPGADKVLKRMQEMIEWADMMAEVYEKILLEWREKHPANSRPELRTEGV